MNQMKDHLKRPDPDLKRFAYDFATEKGLPPEKAVWVSIPGDGSPRMFWRIRFHHPDLSLILMENVPSDGYAERENLAYLQIGRHLFKKGIPVPEIHRADLKRGWFMMEDLGETSLQDWTARNRDRRVMYERVVEILMRLQFAGAEDFNTSWTCQTERYDRFVMRRYESDYFRTAFLNGYLGLKQEWTELEEPFDYLAERASMAENRFFLHRDFQSRNIMISDRKIGVIDWQGGRLGPLAYDLASLLVDPYTALSAEERKSVYDAYLAGLRKVEPKMSDAFQREYPYLAVQRNLQILGAFSFLSKVRRKTYFEEYIPPALHTLAQLLGDIGDGKLVRLKSLIESLSHSLPVEPVHP